MDDARNVNKKGFPVTCQLHCPVLAFHSLSYAGSVYEVPIETEQFGGTYRNRTVRRRPRLKCPREKEQRKMHILCRQDEKLQIRNTCRYTYGHTTITATFAKRTKMSTFMSYALF